MIYLKNMKYIAFFTLWLSTSFAQADICRANPVEVSLSQFIQRDITLPLNGQVKVFVGSEPVSIVDVFSSSSNNFGGLEFSHETIPYVDDRSFLAKLIFKKEPEPDKVYLTIKMSENEVRERVGYPKVLSITISFKHKNKTYKVPLSFTGAISYGCKL